MNDAEWERIMEQKQKEAALPGYGAKCAQRAAEAAKAPRMGDQSEEELLLS